MQRFEVKQEKLKVLTVTVVKATGVSVGGFLGNVETPDPYVMLRVRSSPNAKQRTSGKSDDVNPMWNEAFTFYLNPDKKNILEVVMMDDDFGWDDLVGKVEIDVDTILSNTKITKKIALNEKTMLELILFVAQDDKKELRFSYDLCDEEKNFVKLRKEKVLKNFSKILSGENRPKTVDEVPIIAIMGSGGGYRAACGLSGVFCALQESGILDCAMYVAGLSGSSWYISSLYMQEGWPNSVTCKDMANNLRTRFNTSMTSHFHYDFKRRMDEKAKNGQLVRFTDFFGMAIGDALLSNQESKLSQQFSKLELANAPFPVKTGIRVRKDLPAAEFSEWLEFTPFEYGSAKYGVFGKVNEFGDKYYKGRSVKKFDEAPLHYLLGIWGSAFSIILSTLSGQKNAKKKAVEEQMTKAALEDAERLKSEDDDSEDEELPEDEVEGESWLSEMLNPLNVFSSRRGKAAETFNFCRGLKFKSEKDLDFEDSTGKDKTMCVVDSGIAFNSPFPTMLREERKVDLILSFDFSQRDDGDSEPPFKELMKAEKWARDYGLAFPQVKGNPVTENPDLKECYVFEDSSDVTCPTILHFPIVNKTFRSYLEPGVPRETQEDKDFANFDIFDDPDAPYSSFTFEYAPKTFDRLHELMKFNTLLNIDLIKLKIAHYVKYRRNNPGYERR